MRSKILAELRGNESLVEATERNDEHPSFEFVSMPSVKLIVTDDSLVVYFPGATPEEDSFPFGMLSDCLKYTEISIQDALIFSHVCDDDCRSNGCSNCY